MNVADKLAGWLDAKGFADAFGVIGSGNMQIWDAIARHAKTRLHCFHHEQAAAQAAIVYHRTMGRHAAVLVTTGAGSSNVVTGILSAWMDSIPMFVIAGNEPTKFLDTDARAKGAQGYAFVETLKPITKFRARIRPVFADGICATLDHAWEDMLEPRQGPVVIQVPIDVQIMRTE